MKNSAALAMPALTLSFGGVYADDAVSMRMPMAVVNHHVAAILKHDAAALAADYADPRDAALSISLTV